MDRTSHKLRLQDFVTMWNGQNLPQAPRRQQTTGALQLRNELEQEVNYWISHKYASSTPKAHSTHKQAYFSFCKLLDYQPFPATVEIICRYAAYLGWTKSYSSVQQYLTTLKLLHTELNLPDPLDIYHVRALLKGMRRVKGTQQQQKAPFTPDMLLKIKGSLNLQRSEHQQFYALLLSCFFGLLRIGAVTVCLDVEWGSPHILHRQDIRVCHKGCILSFRGSKTVQYQEQYIKRFCLPSRLILCVQLPLCLVFRVWVQISLNRSRPLPTWLGANVCTLLQEDFVVSSRHISSY